MKGSAPMPFLYVHAVVNGRKIDALVDKGATHNFVCNVAAVRLKLDVGKHTSRMKAIYSKAQAVAGVVQGATIGLGDWKGKLTYWPYSLMIMISFWASTFSQPQRLL